MMWTAKLKGGRNKSASADPVSFSLKKERFNGVVLGIDPSLRGTGLSVLSIDRGEPKLLFSTTLRNPQSLSFFDCLKNIIQGVQSALSQYPIDVAAIEQTIYVQNFQTAQTLGMVRGAILAVLVQRDLPIAEYSPLRVKQAVLGYGRASKQQIAKTLQQMLSLEESLPLDESDATAVALCRAFEK